jgi:hypothetical protein
MESFGVRLVGVNAETAQKLLLTIAFVAALLLVRTGVVWIARFVTGRHENDRVMFWTRQAASLVTAVLAVVALLSIWFDDPQRLTTAIGLFSAGLAFALQRVVTALAGYAVIMRGNTFTVGDRITMGGVRGDVIALTFTQTKIMEMGQPPAVQGADPAIWVRSRQFTGRIVTVTNQARAAEWGEWTAYFEHIPCMSRLRQRPGMQEAWPWHGRAWSVGHPHGPHARCIQRHGSQSAGPALTIPSGTPTMMSHVEIVATSRRCMRPAQGPWPRVKTTIAVMPAGKTINETTRSIVPVVDCDHTSGGPSI